MKLPKIKKKIFYDTLKYGKAYVVIQQKIHDFRQHIVNVGDGTVSVRYYKNGNAFKLVVSLPEWKHTPSFYNFSTLNKITNKFFFDNDLSISPIGVDHKNMSIYIMI